MNCRVCTELERFVQSAREPDDPKLLAGLSEAGRRNREHQRDSDGQGDPDDQAASNNQGPGLGVTTGSERPAQARRHKTLSVQRLMLCQKPLKLRLRGVVPIVDGLAGRRLLQALERSSAGLGQQQQGDDHHPVCTKAEDGDRGAKAEPP